MFVWCNELNVAYCSRKKIFGVNDYFVANSTGIVKTNGSLVFFLCSTVSGNGARKVTHLGDYSGHDIGKWKILPSVFLG